MAPSNNFALLWNEESFIIAETANHTSVRSVAVSISSQEMDGTDLKDDLHITAILQKALRDNRIETKKIHLAVPAKDTIIRSFVLPVMNANELNSAVEFEAKKYIPLSLKDLHYSFYTVNVTENKIKKQRVIFIAVKREMVDKAVGIISSAGMGVVSIETSALGLLRALLAKKIVSKDQGEVVLNISKTSCLAVFIQDGIVYYIREFPMLVPGADKSITDADELVKARFLNEINNSLDFYNRHYMPPKISQMIVIAAKQNQPYDQWLKEDLNIPVKMVDAGSMISLEPSQEYQIGLVEAYGNSMVSTTKVKAEFNFLKKSARSSLTSDTPPFGLSVEGLQEYRNAVQVSIMAVVILAAVFFLFQTLLSKEKAIVDEGKNMQAKYADYTKDDLQAKLDKLALKLKSQKNIPLKAPIEPVLIRLTSLLPQGFWLNSIILNEEVPLKGGKPVDPAATEDASVDATKGNLKKYQYWQISFDGNVYLEDPTQGIKVINSFLTSLKKDKLLALYFSRFNLGEINIQDVNGNKVISFSVTGASL